MNAQEYEIIESIENDSEDDEDDEEEEEEKEEAYVDDLHISKVSLGKKEIHTEKNDEQYSNALPSTVGQAPLLAPSRKKMTLEEEDEDEEDEQLFQTHDRLGQTPFVVHLHLPQLIASNPSPLLPWQDLTIEFIWQSPRTLPASLPYMVTVHDAWTIEPASSSPSPPFRTAYSLCGTEEDFARAVGYDSVAQLTRREASKGSLTLKTPIIAGEWVVNQYTSVDNVWKHVGRSASFRTLDAKIRIQGTVEREDEGDVFVTVKVFRQEMKRRNDL